MSSPNWVQISKKHLVGSHEHLYFVVVLVSEDDAKPFVFHILSHAEVCEDYRRQPTTRRDGQPLVPGREGVAWRPLVVNNLDRWDKLPA